MPSLKLRLKLTNYCENNCWYCSNDVKDYNEISDNTIVYILNKIEKLYKSTLEYKRTKITLTGGNPFYSDKLIKFMKILKNYNLDALVCTDICYPFNEKVLKEYIDYNQHFLIGVNESALKDIEKIVIKIENSKIFIFNILATNYNMNRIDDILSFTKQYNLPLRLSHLFDPIDKYSLIPKIHKCLDKIFDFIEKEDINYNLNYLFNLMYLQKYKGGSHCGYGDSYFYIDIYGNIRRCQMEEAVTSIYENNFNKKIKCESRIFKECKGCVAYKYCMGGCSYANVNKLYCPLYKKVGEFLNHREKNGNNKYISRNERVSK